MPAARRAEDDPADPGNRPVTDLLKDAARLAGKLCKDELALAGSEMRQSGRAAAVSLILIVSGAGFALAAILALLFAAVAALALLLPLWEAALAVSAGAFILGGLCAWLGILGFRRLNVIPERTRRSLAATTRWARAQVS